MGLPVGATIDFFVLSLVAIFFLSFKLGGPFAVAEREIRRIVAGHTRRLRELHPVTLSIALLVIGVLAFFVLAGLRAYLSVWALVIIWPIVIYFAVGKRAGAATYWGIPIPGLATVMRKVSDREAAEHPDGFTLPMQVFASDGAVSRYSSVVSIPRRKSVLALGATRSGKTEAIKHLLDQLRLRPDEPVVVYDHKTDFADTLESWGMGESLCRVSPDGGTVTWNLFAELEAERDVDDVARGLFDTDTGEFFDTAARQVFAAAVKYLDRELDDPTNADLAAYFAKTDREQLHADLVEYDDLVAPASALDPDAGRQAAGVYATCQQQVADLFVDEFAADGEFSIREYMSDPRGRILVLDYPQRQGDSVAPVFRFLLDHSATHALDDADRAATFILDEFARLPPLRRIRELVNVGAGVDTQVILTLQSVAQLQDTYGRDAATAILSGLVTSIVLRCGDDESVEYARSIIGTEFQEYTRHVDRSESLGTMIETGRETKQEEEHPFAKGDFVEFEPGEGVVVRPDGWVYGRLRLLEGGD